MNDHKNQKIAFLFSGQGAQKTGMGRELYETSSAAREVFERVRAATGVDIAQVCFNAPQSELEKTQNAQLCVLTVDLAAMAALNEQQIFADFTAGFSLGEYAALVCCGALTLEDAAILVQKRANIMAQFDGGAMTAVLGIDSAAAQAACAEVKSGYISCVNYNCPGQTVVAGEVGAITELEENLKRQRVRCARLKVSGAFHSDMMAGAAELLQKELLLIDFKAPKIPIILNYSGKTYDQEDTLPLIMTKQCKSPVLWEKSIRELLDSGTTSFIECGYGKVLCGFLKRICPEVHNCCVFDAESLRTCIHPLTSTRTGSNFGS